MDRSALEARLKDAFDADERAARVVARQARDLADSGKFATDLDHQVTADVVVSNLRDAPDGHALVERWNWWLGALELSHGGYEQFRIRSDAVR
ncbi:MAG: hypothetical protein V5A34_09065 [Halapricum sp.]